MTTRTNRTTAGAPTVLRAPKLPTHHAQTGHVPPDWPWFVGPDGTLAELTTLTKQGMLRRFTQDSFIARDCLAKLTTRAAAISHHIPDRAVVTGGTAAWLMGYGATWLPPVQLAALPGAARRPSRATSWTPWPLRGNHYQSWNGLIVATPVRAAADLALLASSLHELRQLAAMLAHEVPAAAALGILDRVAARRPGVVLARHRLAAMALSSSTV